ncbi:hydantoinase/oxoprolinase N-terminal domain-containing protein [Kordiimonas pumila]|uniref:Hydantoinase/oxoprolinase N-terminal domain-containing protein n=1 Tax=Kordiimonas pumila TaxID=2161677 RepID=A0ABV7D5D5_9PROT|nr:hydantoinase/oxoprolinase family protein [Kordiimonas pumila]
MRIGVDVGGTNTDAVLMDGRNVIAAQKTPTTENVSDGIVKAITSVLDQSGKSANAVKCVMIGTTQFTNAFVERRNLVEVGVIRISLPATRGIPPMTDWPDDIRSVIGSNFEMIRGGYQYDGRLNSEFDEKGFREAVKRFKSRGLKAIAISGLFSPVNGEMEDRAEEIILKEIPDCNVTLSSRIGRIGLIERENAAIMNASLAALSVKIVASFRKALADLGILAPFYISQNDGTLMKAEFVEKYPVLTFASGPTNSMRGAAYLSGIEDALVADIGGTTTDIGMLTKGFPRESSLTVDIGGVRTNFRMPDIFALGLGGGSIITTEGDLKVGPKSVGYRLTEDAMVFGGDILTSTDIAVAAGYADIGRKSHISHLPEELIAEAVERIHHIVADGIDRMKTSADLVPLILVGGGAVLINRDIPGTLKVIIPEHAGVANAIGASIAQVGGEIDRVFSYDTVGRDTAISEAKAEAISVAVEAGAAPDTVQVIDIEEVPLAYIPGGAVRLRIKVAGELNLDNVVRAE